MLAESQKNCEDKLLPLFPEFAEFLLAIPEAERHGLLFGIYGPNDQPLSTKRASRYISEIGKAANAVTNKREGRHGTAHDLRRSFGTRWAKRVAPAVLKELMRHNSINTTIRYYVAHDAEDVGDLLTSVVGNDPGNTPPLDRDSEELARSGKQATI
jgi:integrase